jgi:hypothetical protein
MGGVPLTLALLSRCPWGLLAGSTVTKAVLAIRFLTHLAKTVTSTLRNG